MIRVCKTKTNLQAQFSDFVFVMIDKCATCEIEASASPLNPYVEIRLKSAKVESFEVVNRSASMGKSPFWYMEDQQSPNRQVE
jgi:hypothetical protein